MTRQGALPWLALTITILIWAGYLVAVRAAAATTLTPADVGILRSVPAALILLPLTIRRGIFAGGANWGDIFAIGIVGGTCFTFLLNFGAHFAPVADSGVFAPSMLPVFVTILSLAFLGASFRKSQYFGVAVILFGAIAVGGWDALSNASSGAWRGHVLFLCASLSWAVYTIRFRASGLQAIDGAIILVTWSSVPLVLVALVQGSNLFSQSASVISVQLLLGISAGLVANFTFLFAVQRLGPAIPAASAALVPVIAALGGLVFLGEPIGTLKWIGIFVVAVGVLLASGLIANRQRIAQH